MQNKRVELKNKIKGIAKAALALSMSLVMPLTSIPASAAENHEMLDPDRIGSISITFSYYDETALILQLYNKLKTVYRKRGSP